MTQVMKGIRVLEVAQFTFVPAAGALLADWGADVIKVEHPVRGDTQRGMITIGDLAHDPDRFTLMDHSNRGKRSVGIDSRRRTASRWSMNSPGPPTCSSPTLCPTSARS